MEATVTPITTWSHTTDPTLDILDGSRVAQITIRLGETVIATHRVDGCVQRAVRKGVLRWGWAVLAVAPLPALFGLPGLTAALALFGVVTGILGTLRHHSSRPRTRFVAGSGPDVDLPLDDPSLYRFPMVTAGPDGPTLHFLPKMEGEVVTGCVTCPLQELERLRKTYPSLLVPGALSFAIPSDARIEIRLAQTVVEIASVTPARRIQPSSGKVQWREQLYQAGSFGVHAVLVLAALLVSPPAKKTRPIEEVPKKLVEVTFVPSFRGDPVPFHPSFVRAKDPYIGNTRDRRAPPGLYALRGPINNRDPHLAQRLAQGEAGRSGVLGLLTNMAGSLGPSGVGLRSAPGVRFGRLTVRGALDRTIIRRVVRRHVNEVKYCFQNVLQGNPNLAGKVVLSFVISADGVVRRAAIGGSTLGNPSVTTCLASAAKRWLYPRPRRGTVQVKVPLTFR